VEFFADIGARGHAVDFGEVERGEAVAVHRLAVAGGGDEAGLLAVLEDEFQDALGFAAVAAVVGCGAVGEEGEAGESHDGGGVSAFVVDVAVDGDVLGEVGEALVDGGAGFDVEFVLEGAVAADGGAAGLDGAGGLRGAGGDGAKERGAEGGEGEEFGGVGHGGVRGQKTKDERQN
jgi:hypothetical protein